MNPTNAAFLIVFSVLSAVLASPARITSPAPPCPSDYSIEVYYPDSDCTKFWQCSDGTAYLKPCPPGQHWDTSRITCDDPAIAKCTGQGWSSTIKPTTITTPVPITTITAETTTNTTPVPETTPSTDETITTPPVPVTTTTTATTTSTTAVPVTTTTTDSTTITTTTTPAPTTVTTTTEAPQTHHCEWWWWWCQPSMANGIGQATTQKMISN